MCDTIWKYEEDVMNVNRYIFQSPYSSQVQVGRPDISVKQEGSSAVSSQSAPVVNETLSNAQSFAATQTSEVTPTVSSNNLLDVYV